MGPFRAFWTAQTLFFSQETLVCGFFSQEFKKTIPTVLLWEGFVPSFPQTGGSWNGDET
jgi:hypothetical protein